MNNYILQILGALLDPRLTQAFMNSHLNHYSGQSQWLIGTNWAHSRKLRTNWAHRVNNVLRASQSCVSILLGIARWGFCRSPVRFRKLCFHIFGYCTLCRQREGRHFMLRMQTDGTAASFFNYSGANEMVGKTVPHLIWEFEVHCCQCNWAILKAWIREQSCNQTAVAKSVSNLLGITV